MALSLFPENRLTSLRILDPCCGTGGFLVSAVNHIREVLTTHEREKGRSDHEIVARVNERVRDIAMRNIFGLDINPFLVQTSQMNLVMHGDGSANVFQADSLYLPGEWHDVDAAEKIGHGYI